MFEVFDLDIGNSSTAFVPYSLNALFSQASSTVNIDSYPEGEFVIVWDDAPSVCIATEAGTAFAAAPTLSNKVAQLSSTGYKLHPDVAISDFLVNGYHEVNYTYDEQTGGGVAKVYLHQEDFNTIYSGSSSNSGSVVSSASGHTYLFPRIACESIIFNAGNYDNLTIVWGDDDGNGANNIDGYTLYNGLGNNYVYTDGGVNSPSDISSAYNRLPVVSYEVGASSPSAGSINFVVCWVSDFNDNPYFNATSCAALRCNMDGTWDNTGTNLYYGVCYLNGTNGNTSGDQYAISIAGRHATSMLYTFWDLQNMSDIVYKNTILASGSPFRYSFSQTVSDISLVGNPLNEFSYIKVPSSEKSNIYKVLIVENSGRVICEMQGEIEEINQKLHRLVNGMSAGIYNFSMSNSEGTLTKTIKSVKL